MIKNHKSKPTIFIPNDFSQIGDYMRNHWMKIGLLALLLYLLFQKDINFQFSMNDTKLEEEKEQKKMSEAETKLKLVPATIKQIEESAPIVPMDLAVENKAPEVYIHQGEPQANEMDTDVELAKPIAAPEISDAQANGFCNLIFVLNPSYIKKVNPNIVNQKNKVCSDYIQEFSNVAIAQMKADGIPASIKLAQALLESDAGTSRLAGMSNNHFGIKCFSKSCAKGHCKNFTDDSHKDFFRVYPSAVESFKGHSEILRGKRYAHLKKLGTKNYKEWAYGLKKAGYATDKKYAEKLIRIIEAMRLYAYDGLD